MPTSPEDLLAELATRLTAALGGTLLSLAVHGSLVTGGFVPGRSDVDLLAVLAGDPDPAVLPTLAGVHRALVDAHPGWVDHVEVDYVSAAAVRDVVAGARVEHLMARISPGEPLHLTPASRLHLLGWHAALTADRVLVGLPPARVLPPIPPGTVADVVAAHLAQWPTWVLGMRTPGGQAYAVLTVCRGAATLRTAGPVPKRDAAAHGIRSTPQWAPLIRWAHDWWYAGGSDDDPGRYAEVVRFVRTVVPAALEDHQPS